MTIQARHLMRRTLIGFLRRRTAQTYTLGSKTAYPGELECPDAQARTLSAFAVGFMLVLALIFPPFSRTWERYASYALSLVVLLPILQWWFEREIRIGLEKLRTRDGVSSAHAEQAADAARWLVLHPIDYPGLASGTGALVCCLARHPTAHCGLDVWQILTTRSPPDDAGTALSSPRALRNRRIRGWQKNAVFTDLSTAVERSESAPSLERIESDEPLPASVSTAASLHPSYRARV